LLLVTRATGYIGGRLIAALPRGGVQGARVFVRNPTGSPVLPWIQWGGDQQQVISATRPAPWPRPSTVSERPPILPRYPIRWARGDSGEPGSLRQRLRLAMLGRSRRNRSARIHHLGLASHCGRLSPRTCGVARKLIKDPSLDSGADGAPGRRRNIDRLRVDASFEDGCAPHGIVSLAAPTLPAPPPQACWLHPADRDRWDVLITHAIRVCPNCRTLSIAPSSARPEYSLRFTRQMMNVATRSRAGLKLAPQSQPRFRCSPLAFFYSQFGSTTIDCARIRSLCADPSFEYDCGGATRHPSRGYRPRSRGGLARSCRSSCAWRSKGWGMARSRLCIGRIPRDGDAGTTASPESDQVWIRAHGVPTCANCTHDRADQSGA
jgi:hypothetical protein